MYTINRIIICMFSIHQIQTLCGTFILIEQYYWRNDQLIVIDTVRNLSSVRLIMDPICWGCHMRGTPLKDISFQYAGGNFYCCSHVSYRTYQDNDTVFFNGQASSTCPIHPWSRPVWLTPGYGGKLPHILRVLTASCKRKCIHFFSYLHNCQFNYSRWVTTKCMKLLIFKLSFYSTWQVNLLDKINAECNALFRRFREECDFRFLSFYTYAYLLEKRKRTLRMQPSELGIHCGIPMQWFIYYVQKL